MAAQLLLTALCVAFVALNGIEGKSCDSKEHLPNKVCMCDRFNVLSLSGATDAKYKYVAILQPSTFFEAWQDCNIKGGHLASIESPQEQARVEKAMAKARDPRAVFFFGGTDLGRKGRWMWIHSNKPIGNGGYTNFFPGQPDNGGGSQDCLTVGVADGYNRGKWDDQNCMYRLDGYICAFKSTSSSAS